MRWARTRALTPTSDERVATCTRGRPIAIKLAISSLLWSVCAATSAEWDVANTGQPYEDVKFTVTEGTWMSVDVRPDGRSIVFDLLGDIYTIPASGGDATLTHGGPALETRPRFSPDGSKILYISDRSGSDNLWVSNVDGSEARQVSHETTITLAAPAWDAQRNYVAATRFHPRPSQLVASEIWLYHLDGGRGRLLVPTPQNNKSVHEPQSPPDGVYLYYAENILLRRTVPYSL